MRAGWIAGALLLITASVPAAIATTTGHTDDGDVVADSVITPAQLATLLASGPQRITIELSDDGRAVDVEVDSDDVKDEDEAKGRVLAIDAAAKTMTVAHLGVVLLDGARELELRDDRDVSLDAWMGEVARALAAGERVGVEVDGRFGANGLAARKVELERDHETEVKATIRTEHFDAAGATLRLGGVAHDLSGVRIERDD